MTPVHQIHTLLVDRIIFNAVFIKSTFPFHSVPKNTTYFSSFQTCAKATIWAILDSTRCYTSNHCIPFKSSLSSPNCETDQILESAFLKERDQLQLWRFTSKPIHAETMPASSTFCINWIQFCLLSGFRQISKLYNSINDGTIRNLDQYLTL